MLTACGIETLNIVVVIFIGFMLQQCLPLAVLKPKRTTEIKVRFLTVATVLTACGIETVVRNEFLAPAVDSCNSAYRLRY